MLEPTLSSIRNIGQILALLDSSANGQSDKINLLVLNHTKSDKASLINCHGVQRALGCEVDVILPYVPTHFLTKESLGRSLLKGNRKVSRAFDLLASKATGGDTTTKRRRWLRGA